MKKSQRWLALAFALALAASTIAPMSAWASRGDRPLDSPEVPPGTEPVLYGDPDGSGSGSPMQFDVAFYFRLIFLASARVSPVVQPYLAADHVELEPGPFRARPATLRGSR